MAQVTGKDIYAYPHRELFGAWGAALVSRERVKELELQGKAVRSAYRGWEWLEESFARREVSCLDHFGPLSCGVRNCKLKIFTIGQDEVITGGGVGGEATARARQHSLPTATASPYR